MCVAPLIMFITHSIVCQYHGKGKYNKTISDSKLYTWVLKNLLPYNIRHV